MSGVSVTTTAGYPYTVLLDEQGAITYVGKAAPNTQTSAPAWQIRRIQTVGSLVSVEYADGNNRFDKIWDDRASLSYS